MLDLEFEIVSDTKTSFGFSDGCSNGARSACCTRVCTKMVGDSLASLKAWDLYLDINAGVLQY